MREVILIPSLVLCLLAVIGTCTLVMAHDFPLEGDAKLKFANISYEELCEIDGKFCTKVVTPDGRFKEPKKTILVVFQRFRKKLQEIADLFGVDPRLIAAVVTTEHTLNVQIDEVIAQGLSQTEIGSDGHIAVFNFSYGFGQIYESAARDAEVIVAEFEQREPYSPNKVSGRLKTFEGALTYAAALLVNAERIYAEHGFEIGDQPGVLATLYNLGGDRERAADAERNKRLPRINYFGWFVEHNWEKFTEILNSDIPTFHLHTDDYDNERVVSEGKFSVLVSKDHLPVYFLQEPAPLFVKPDKCKSQDSSDTLTSQYNSVLDRDMQPKANFGVGKFNIIQESIDCQGEPWALARFSEGNLGWIRHSDVVDTMDFRYTARTCARKSYKACIEEISGVVGTDSILDFNELDGIVAVRLASFDDSIPVDYKLFGSSCLDPEILEIAQTKYAADLEKWENFIARAKVDYVSFKNEASFLLFWLPQTIPNEAQAYKKEEIEAIQTEIARARETLRSLPELGYAAEEKKPYSRNIYRKMMAWTEHFELACNDQCYGPDISYMREFFLDFNEKNLKDPKFILDRLDRFSSSSIRPESRTEILTGHFFPSTFNESLGIWMEITFRPLAKNYDLLVNSLIALSVSEQEQEINRVCSILLTQLPSFQREMAAYFQELKRHADKEYFEDLGLDTIFLISILARCDLLGQYFSARINGIQPERMQTIYPIMHPEIQANDSNVSIAMLPIMDLQPADFEGPLLRTISSWRRSLENLISRGEEQVELIAAIRSGDFSGPQDKKFVFSRNRVRPPTANCAYNPITTMERIDALLKLDCVEQVLVPNEEYLVKNYGSPEHDGTVKVMEKRDRVEFTLNPNCDDEGMEGQMIRTGLY